MKRITILYALPFALVAWLSSPAFAAVLRWTGAGGDDNWTTAGNWSSAPGNPTGDTISFASSDTGNKSIVDTSWTIGELVYTNIIHTTDLNATSTLQVDSNANVGVHFATANVSHNATATWTNGVVVIGSAANQRVLTVGRNNATSGGGTINGTLNLAAVTVTANVSQVNIGVKDGSTSTANGTITVGTGASFVIGSVANLAEINIGQFLSGNNGSTARGTLVATNGVMEIHASDLYLARRPTANNNASTLEGRLYWNQATTIDANNIYVGYGVNANALLSVPTGGTLKLGTVSDPVTNFWIGSNFNSAAGATGEVDAASAAVSGYVRDVRIGNRAAGANSATGTLSMGAGSDLVVGSTGSAGTFLLGTAANANAGTAAGTANLNGGQLTVYGELSVGRKTVNTSVNNGTINIASGATLQVGSGTASDIFNVGRNDDTGTGGSAAGTVAATGGTLKANLSEWNVGYRPGSGSSPVAGTLDLTALSSLTATTITMRVGLGQGATGRAFFGPGQVVANSVTVNNNAASSSGFLQTSGTVFQVNTTLTIAGAGSVTNLITGTSSGFDIANSSPTAFTLDSTLALGRGMNIQFLENPDDPLAVYATPAQATDIFYGFKWAGNRTNELNTLVTAGKLQWDDTTWLTGSFYDKVTIFYDSVLGTDATYIGFYTMQMIPEPSTVLLVVCGVGLFWRECRRRRK